MCVQAERIRRRIQRWTQQKSFLLSAQNCAAQRGGGALQLQQWFGGSRPAYRTMLSPQAHSIRTKEASLLSINFHAGSKQDSDAVYGVLAKSHILQTHRTAERAFDPAVYEFANSQEWGSYSRFWKKNGCSRHETDGAVAGIAVKPETQRYRFASSSDTREIYERRHCAK